jgi:hypothetical protein
MYTGIYNVAMIESVVLARDRKRSSFRKVWHVGVHTISSNLANL